MADASLIAAAERLRASEVATLDQRHFRAITPAHVTALKLPASRPDPIGRSAWLCPVADTALLVCSELASNL